MPARNEARDLGAALKSVLGQRGVDIEVIVINDHSTDRTGAIADEIAAADSRVTVLHDPESRPGWLGKANAMDRGVARANGDYILFTDGDILHHPDCFRTALSELQRSKLDLLSLFPRIDNVSLWENVNLPIYQAGFASIAKAGMDDPNSPDALAAGAFILVRAEAHRAAGGCATIRGEMLDDVETAKMIKRRSGRVAVRAAPDLLHVRMFKGNRDAFWGTTKNILAGVGPRVWLAPIAMVLPIVVFWLPLIIGVIGIVMRDAVLMSAGFGTFVIQYACLLPSRDLFPLRLLKALCFPLVAINVFCCMSRSLYHRIARGAVVWRGRSIAVERATQ
jgi:chlorobactene glucosyltransferase